MPSIPDEDLCLAISRVHITLAAVRWRWLLWQRFSHNNRTQCSSTLATP
jgi:hypothetical protein